MRVGHRLWPAALAVACLSAPLPAHADDAASTGHGAADAKPVIDVKADVDAARQLTTDHDFGSAYLRYQRVYDATHDPQWLVSMAACEKSMQQYALAARLIEQALGAPPPGLVAADAADAHELYNSLLPFLGHVRVSVDPPGATVMVDDMVVGQAPLVGDVLVDPGDRRFRVSKPGFREFSTLLTVTGTSQKLLEAKLTPHGPDEHGRARRRGGVRQLGRSRGAGLSLADDQRARHADLPAQPGGRGPQDPHVRRRTASR
jgi:hypothetical protein